TKIQDLYMAGHKDEAAAAVPTKMVEDIALVGPRDKIRDDLDMWRDSMLTSMLINGNVETLQMMAELIG
ncbi:MAG: LLM class F420-dependent oxidoreductase, partial [Actinobacteria bacterium]|nr:LLM class F420-dependent oxidoreductase [Actinomycetota bacterium]